MAHTWNKQSRDKLSAAMRASWKQRRKRISDDLDGQIAKLTAINNEIAQRCERYGLKVIHS